MSVFQYGALEDTFYFWFALNDTSGSGADGTSPLFDVRLGGASSSAIPTLSGTPTLLSHANYANGSYEIAVAATAANGFAASSIYGVFCNATVSAQNPTGFVGGLKTAGVVADLGQLGYLGGIWYSDVTGTAAAVVGVNGVASLPVSTAANVVTLLAATKFRSVFPLSGSTYTFASTYGAIVFVGEAWTAAQGGQNLSNTMIIGARITGTSTGVDPKYGSCSFGACTIAPGAISENCTIGGVVTLLSAGFYEFVNLAAETGSSAIIDGNAIATTTVVSITNLAGELEIRNFSTSCTLVVSGAGKLTLDSGQLGLTVEVRGYGITVVNNGSAVVTVYGPEQLLDLTNGVETNRTVRQALRLGLAADGGKTNGMNTSTAHIRDTNDTTNRVTATLDGNGNRTAVTLNL